MPDSNPEDRQKVALVTGGDQGSGRGVAEALAEDGWRVHVTYRTPEKGRRAVERLGEERVHEADLVDGAAAARAVEAVIEREGRLDAVVHAVGPYATGPLSETGPETFDAMLRGNLFTAIHVVTAARAHLRAASGAYLFFGCAGLESWRAREVTTAYIAAKAALLVTVRGLALEEALGRKEGMAAKYGNLGVLSVQRGEREAGIALVSRARDLYAEMGMAPQVEQADDWLREQGEAP